MFVNSDFSDLLKIFNARNVRYLVIGGYAVIQYAEPRYTKDLDVWISTDVENARAIYTALREFGAPLTNLTVKDFSQEGYFFQMGVPPVRVDVLMGIPGLHFEEAWGDAWLWILTACQFPSFRKCGNTDLSKKRYFEKSGIEVRMQCQTQMSEKNLS